MVKKIMKRKEVEDFRDMHTIRETYEDPTTLMYSNNVFKMGKDWDFSWHFLYWLFVKEDYSKLSFDEGYEEKSMDVYLKISHSYLHKVIARLTILPYSEIIGIMVQQDDTSNWWSLDAWEQNACAKHIVNKVL